MAEESPPRRLSTRDRFKPRVDKALLLNAGRMMERRTDRERDALVARLDVAERELEKVRRDGAVSAAMAMTTGGAACKVLQREVGLLRAKLAEVEAGTPTTSVGNGHCCPSSSDSFALATPTRIAELEGENRRLALKLEELELKGQQEKAARSRAPNGDAGGACRPCEELSDAVERLKGRVDVLTEDNVKLSSDLKLTRAKLSQGVGDDPKMRPLQNQVEEGKTKLAAATAARQVEVQQHKRRVDELEGALRRKDKEREEAVRGWQVRYEAAARASTREDESARRKATRYDALLVSLRLSDDEVSQLLDDPDTPPIRQHCPNLSLLDLLWLLTDQHDEHAAAVQVLEDKLERCEGEQARAQKQGMDERERLQKTVSELQARLEVQVVGGEGSTAPRKASLPQRPLSTTATPSNPSSAVLDRLTSTIANLTDEVEQLRDENMTLLLKLAGADE
ncbi:hypothetical protein JCM8208_002246 [Rhodotorula glutinis]